MYTTGGTLLAESAGFKISHVVYKGGAPLLNDLIGGRIEVVFDYLPSTLPQVKAGRARAVLSVHRGPARGGFQLSPICAPSSADSVRTSSTSGCS